MARILVTGGTGTLGRALVPRLLEDGHTVRILSRRRAPRQLQQNLQWALGDLVTGGGLPTALATVDTVVHLATSPRRMSRDVEVRGTRRLAAAARDARVQRIVFTSVVGADRLNRGYYQHKREAEEIVESAALDWAIMRATRFHPSLDRYLWSLLRFPIGALPPDLLFQPLDPGEFAEAVREAITSGASGRQPDFGGPDIRSLDDLAQAWMAARAVKRRILRMGLGGTLASGMKQGYETAPSRCVGRITWEDWLAATYAPREPATVPDG